MGRDFIDESSGKNTGPPKRSKRGAADPKTGARAEETPRRNTALAPGLYLVATPIGNLGDITLRALDTLRTVDLVTCEDSRVTGKLLAHYGINVPMIAYHEHNAAQVRPGLIAQLSAGKRIALVSDAGTPLISDPGYKLVSEVAAAGLTVIPIPGASAILAGLTVAAVPTDRFLFAGFLPSKSGARRRALEELATAPASLIFYESPRRLAASLGDMAAVLGDRPAAIARELTKLHEEIRRDSLAALAGHYGTADTPKGEVVVVVGPPIAKAALDDKALDDLLAIALETMSVRDAADKIAAETGHPRRAIYQRARDRSEGRTEK